MSTNILRALDPLTELDLFQQAYSWRTGQKKNTRVNRMPFEEFVADYSNKVVIGLFNGKLCAVYVFIEVGPHVYEAHFTSRKDVPTEDVFAGGKTMLNWFHSQGAIVTAKIVEKNRPLRAFVESLGFKNVSCEEISLQEANKRRTLRLVSYVSKKDSSP